MPVPTRSSPHTEPGRIDPQPAVAAASRADLIIPRIPETFAGVPAWVRNVLPTAVSLTIPLALLGAILYVNAITPAPETDRVSLSEINLTPAIESSRPITAPLERPPVQAPTDPQASTDHPPPPTLPDPPRVIELVGLTNSLDAQSPDLISSVGAVNGAGVIDAIAGASSSEQPFASFAGLRSQAASRIVYVVDASGAMASSFSFVKDQLKRSVDRLAPTQHFQIVLFGDTKNRPEGTPPFRVLTPKGSKPTLIRATPANQQAVADWIDAALPGGRSNPADGLRAAFEFKPDLIFMLSRSIQRSGPNASWGRGKDAILADLDRLNPLSKHTARRRVTIKTIQFLDEDPTGTMKAIALTHGDGEGSYRLVRWEDLTKDPDQAEQVALAQALSEDDNAKLERAAQRLASIENDGSALSVLFGVPLPEQRDSVSRATEFVLAVLATFPEASASSDYDPRNPPDARLPLLRARAAILLASLSDDPAWRRQLATTAIANVEQLSLIDTNAEAARRVALGVALHLVDDTNESRRVLRSLISEADLLKAKPSIVAEAMLALLLTAQNERDRALGVAALRDATELAPFVVERLPDPLWRLAAAEATARTLLPEPSLAPGALDDLLALTDDESLITDPRQRTALVYAKLAAATDAQARSLDWPAFPPEAAFARAVVLARRATGWNEAVRLFEQVADRADAGALAPEALWEAAIVHRVRNTPESRARATQHLERIAREFPESPRAADALSAAVADASAAGEGLPESYELGVLRLAVEKYPDHPQADLWRYKYAQRLSGLDVLDVLEPIKAGTPEGAAAAMLYLETIADLTAGPLAPNSLERVALLRRAARYAERHDARPRAALFVDLGEAELDSGDPGRAMPLLIRAAALKETIPGGQARLDLARARAHLAVGQTAEAFELLRTLASSLDASGDRTDMFWHAWTLMLEILAERAGQGESADADAARTNLARLRLLDPVLGAEPWRSRIEAAARQLDSAP